MTIIQSTVSFEALTGVPEIVGYVFVFTLGAIIGSFLNVVIHRVPNEQSIVFPNSACPDAERRSRHTTTSRSQLADSFAESAERVQSRSRSGIRRSSC